jgi:hypothetical protein
MLNRSAAQIRYTAAFCEWLQAIHAHKPPAADVPSRTLYLIPAFDEPEEAEEVVENVFEEIFRQELKTWLPDERAWPDTADCELFVQWFNVQSFPIVEDLGPSDIHEEE